LANDRTSAEFDGMSRLDPSIILSEVAAYFGVSVEDLRSTERSRPIVQARTIAMYLVRDLTDLSLPRVGAIFGGRDHTTVLHAWNKVVGALGERGLLSHQVDDITRRIRRRSPTNGQLDVQIVALRTALDRLQAMGQTSRGGVLRTALATDEFVAYHTALVDVLRGLVNVAERALV
jgi:Bacterial dnaA protein helix-turn-helix